MKKILKFLKDVVFDETVILWWLSVISFISVLLTKDGNSSVPAIFFIGAIIVRMLSKREK